MRPQDERDQQTLDIAMALVFCALTIVALGGIVWLGGNFFDGVIGRVGFAFLVGVALVSVVLIARRIAAGNRRRR